MLTCFIHIFSEPFSLYQSMIYPVPLGTVSIQYTIVMLTTPLPINSLQMTYFFQKKKPLQPLKRSFTFFTGSYKEVQV
jgi:hypothetical protein